MTSNLNLFSLINLHYLTFKIYANDKHGKENRSHAVKNFLPKCFCLLKKHIGNKISDK